MSHPSMQRQLGWKWIALGQWLIRVQLLAWSSIIRLMTAAGGVAEIGSPTCAAATEVQLYDGEDGAMTNFKCR